MLYVIGIVCDKNGSVKFYHLVDTDSKSCNFICIDDIETIYKNGLCDKIVNAVYDSSFKGLTGKGGMSISNLPKLRKVHSSISVVGQNSLCILAEVYKENELKGYVICDAKGYKKNITKDSLTSVSNGMILINYKLNNDIAEPLYEPFDREELREQIQRQSYNSGLNESKVEVDKNIGTSMIGIYSLEKVRKSEFYKSSEMKFVEAIGILKVVSPYYWLMLQTIQKIPAPADKVPTMGVTEDKFYYNPEFIATQDVAELVFILIHEICHIGMQHVIRRGKRDPMLWNYATDIYINESIVREFDLTIGVEKSIGTIGKIKAPAEYLYISTLGEVIDLAKDIPEIIYSRLEQELDDQSGQGQGQGQGQESDNQSGQEQSQGQGQSSDSQDGQGQSNDSQDGQGQSSDSQDGQKEGQGSQSSQSDGDNSFGSGSGGKGTDEQTVTYNGKKLEGRTFDELKSETGRKTKDEKQKSDEMSRQKIQSMNTKVKMVEAKTGESLSSSTSGTELLQRYIDFGLSSNVDWRTVLKNMCKYKAKKQYTLAFPNQDYMAMGTTVAGRRKIAKERSVDGIKICIDVSGSVSDSTLQWYLSEVANIFNHFKVTGELIYWSTEVGDAGEFSSVKDFLKVKPKSTGGTDITCLFEYLSGEGKTQTGKTEQQKVKDIVGVVVVTDGCFAKNYGKYERAFGKKTLFIIDGGGMFFDPLFGTKVDLHNKED